jgi:hypothetical protein
MIVVDEPVQQAREVQRRKEADDRRRRGGGVKDGMGKMKPLTSFFSVPKRMLKLADVERPCRMWTTTSTTMFPSAEHTRTLQPTD